MNAISLKRKAKVVLLKGLRLFFIALFCTLLLLLSTFGWNLWNRSEVNGADKLIKLEEQLKAHVFKLSSQIGDRSVFDYKKLEAAANYISSQFSSMGYAVDFQTFETEGKEVRNIIAVKKGKSKPEEIIVVGAHYDTCFNPGADDNASAVAGLLELARGIIHIDTERTVYFVAFVNEEPPFFQTDSMGSVYFVKHSAKDKKNIIFAIILEMIGYYTNEPNSQRYPPFLGMLYPNRGNYIAVIGNLNSRNLTKTLVSEFKKQTDFPIESLIDIGLFQGTDFSDHWSFWQQGIPAVMITDTSFYRNPFYHTQKDTADTLNYTNMASVVDGFSAVLQNMANKK
jgi:Zn-dependent M28 family amino/carboxypeptidase